MPNYGGTLDRTDNTQKVSIVDVNPKRREATGLTNLRTQISIDCRFPVGGIYTLPSIGEQWIVQRNMILREWRLVSRLPVNDNNLAIEPVEGQVIVGGTGPIDLNGSTVRVGSDMSVTGVVSGDRINIGNLMQLGKSLYRTADGILESRAADDENAPWTPILGGGGGPGGGGGVTSINGRTGDISLASSDLSDLSSIGQGLLTSVSDSAARSLIGAVTLGMTNLTAKPGNWLPALDDITGITGVGRSLLTADSFLDALQMMGAMAEDWRPSLDDVTGITNWVRNFLTQAVDSVTSGNILGLMSNLWRPFVDDIVDASNFVRNFLTQASDKLSAQNILGALSEFWRPLAEDIQDVTSYVRNWLTGANTSTQSASILKVLPDTWRPSSADITDATSFVKNWITTASDILDADDIRSTFNGQYSGGNIALLAVQNIVRTIRRLAEGVISPSRLPKIGIGSITEDRPNLVLNPSFLDDDAITDAVAWVRDSVIGRLVPGSARATADGTEKKLLSNEIFCDEGEEFDAEIWTTWSGVAATGQAASLSVVAYNAANEVLNTTLIDQVSNPGASATWTKLSGSYTAPTGISYVRTLFRVTPNATAGQFWFDDVLMRKKATTLPQSFVGGLSQKLQDLDDNDTGLDDMLGNLAGNINNALLAAAEDLGEGIGNVREVFNTIFRLRKRADDAQEAAVVAQQQLQALLSSNEAGASGGKSGGDDINRANSTSLGPLWIGNNIGGGQLVVKDNSFELSYTNVEEAGRGYALWDGESPVSDYFQNSIVLRDGFTGGIGAGNTNMYLYLICRWDGLWSGTTAANTIPRNGWMVRINRIGNIQLYMVVNGVLGSPVATSDVDDPRSGDVIQIRCGSFADERAIAVLYNGRTVAAYVDNADASAMGPAYRKHGLAMYGEGVPFVGWKRPSAVSSYSWSDIPGGGIILGNTFRYSRVAAAAVNQTNGARIPANFFDTQVMSEEIKPPAGTTYDYTRGEFVVTKEGWWRFNLNYTGTTREIASSSAAVVRPALFYGQGVIGTTNIPMSYQRFVNPNQDDPGTFGDQGATTVSLINVLGTVDKYCLAGERVAPGWGTLSPLSCVGSADGYAMAFSGTLLR